MQNNRSRQAGFTLIEIAVVLVIVGLLIGGIMKGQEMINSAKVKNLGQDLRNVGTYAMAYQDKFRAVPGDDAAADQHVGAPATAKGNGDGRISGNDEPGFFWQHVRLAGIASGEGTTAPKNALGGDIKVTSDKPVSTWAASLFACATNVTGAVARQLDTTMDDTNTVSGSLRTLSGTATHSVEPKDDAEQFTVCMSF